jgi:thiol:disulfide interchange protein/DsbC/DsbD-like thiol-disulfide interchange protein
MRSMTRAASAWLVLVVVLLVGGAPASVPGAGASTPIVRVELLGEAGAITPGTTFWVGLRQRIPPGWHTYWSNPGDSGEPPHVEWTLPEGFAAGEIHWPHPERIAVGPAMSYGYSDEVVLPIPLTVPGGLTPGTRVTLRGQASWVVCEKVCVPEDAPVALSLPVVAGPPPPEPRGAALIAAARRAVPSPSPWPASFVVTPERFTLEVAARGLTPERVAEVWFYPAAWGLIEHAAPQHARTSAAGITLEVARGALPDAGAGPVEGVLVVTERLDGGLARQALAIRAEPRGAGPDVASTSLLGAMVLALVGGLVLNLMPCVLPVLSVKALGLVHHTGGRPGVHGAAYTGGVLACFALVAGTLIALRAAGQQLGWGFQLQSPVFVTLLAYVLFVMALALSGVLVIGGSLAGAGQALAGRAGYAGSFFTGALATVAATPCTAPFMGAAVGWALVQPWLPALLVFQALGLGLALPYLVLTVAPAWRRALPRPGPWMIHLERGLAFPLYASVAWLVWVVSQQAGSTGLAAALGGLVAIAFAAWLYAATRTARGSWRRLATGAALALTIGAVGATLLDPHTQARGPAAHAGETGWEPFSSVRLAELRAAGTPVFVNVTAAWCITCLVNERVALRSAAVTEAFARQGIVPLRADWTRRDPDITRVLGTFGRSGVPLYLLYPAGAAGTPTVLPQILTERIVLDATEAIGQATMPTKEET